MDTVNNNRGLALQASLYSLLKQRLADLELVDGQQIVVCLGGGADSQTVLDLVDRYRQEHPQFQYLAIHLDHAFHPKSEEWAQGLIADCERRNFPMVCEPLAVASGARISIEEAGRDARYARMAEIAQDNAVFLLGQHRNDQIETFFLQLKRGAGPKGLAAMAATAPRNNQTWVRPLLTISKDEIYAYAHSRELFWIEDDTNYDIDIDRNFFRHEIVPKIEERWPHFGDALLRSTELCAESQALQAELLAERVQPHIDSEGRLATNWLVEQSLALQRGALRFWIETQGARMPSYAQLEQLRQQMLHTTNDAKPQVRWGTFQVIRHTSSCKDRLLTLTFLSKK